ncbi:MAG TPA: hypothetical protein VF266_17150 [Thermoanaerobaculia bacterium]
MKKRVVLLLVVALTLTLAPAAMANHCKVCRPLWEACGQSASSGWNNCTWDESTNKCITSSSCSHSVAALTPLASEFQVASVENLDEPQAGANETRVASLETAPTAAR